MRADKGIFVTIQPKVNKLDYRYQMLFHRHPQVLKIKKVELSSPIHYKITFKGLQPHIVYSLLGSAELLMHRKQEGKGGRERERERGTDPSPHYFSDWKRKVIRR